MGLEFLRDCAKLSRSLTFGAHTFSNRARHRQSPSVIFLPAYGREGAALHRIYNVATRLRARGVAAHVLPWKFTLAERRRWLAVLAPDIVVMQGTRHALNRPALYPGHRIVLDLDDADFHLPRFQAAVCSAMQHVVGVMAGSEYIAAWCRASGAPEVQVVWTGAPVSRRRRPAQDRRAPVLAWAQTRPMNYAHEAALLRRVLPRVAQRHPGTVLRLYDRRPGDDPGFATSFAAPGLRIEWQARAGYEAYLASLDDVALGLAPLLPDDPFCRAKSFGKLLAYLDRKVAVVASDFGEPRAVLTPATARLCQNDDDWVAGISGLLPDADARDALATAGFATFKDRLSTEATSARVVEVLGQFIARAEADTLTRAAAL